VEVLALWFICNSLFCTQMAASGGAGFVAIN
jgi:hypothetical protein